MEEVEDVKKEDTHPEEPESQTLSMGQPDPDDVVVKGFAVTDDMISKVLRGEDGLQTNVTPDCFEMALLSLGKAMIEKFGGPQQYLMRAVTDLEKFAKDLRAFFPARSDVAYITQDKLPLDTTTLPHVHVADLSFLPDASTKPPPYQSLTLELLEMILKRSCFESDVEPLSLWGGPLPSGSNCFGWTCFVKGAARSCTVLMIAHISMSQSWDLQSLAPGLFASMLAITCRRGAMSHDFEAVAIENAAECAKAT